VPYKRQRGVGMRVQVQVKNTFLLFEPICPNEPRMLKSLSMPNLLDSMPIGWQGGSVPSIPIVNTMTKHRQAGRDQKVKVEDKHRHINQHYDDEEIEEMDGQSSHSGVSFHAGRAQEVEVEVKHKHINRHLNFQDFDEMDGQSGHIEVSSSYQASSSSRAEQTDKEIMRGASWSAGSIGHDDKDCRPCAWNWKPSGCSKGSSCEFCHLCEDGKLQARQRDRRVQKRLMHEAERRKKKNKKNKKIGLCS